MKQEIRIEKRVLRHAAAVLLGSMALSTGCNEDQVNAVLVGVQAATNELQGSKDDEITIRDWLSSELSDH